MSTECPMVYSPCAECSGTCSKAASQRHKEAHTQALKERAMYDRIITYSLVCAWIFAMAGIIAIIPEALARQAASYQTQ